MTSAVILPNASTTRAASIACCRSAVRGRRSRRNSKGRSLFALLGREPRFKHVPLALLDSIVFGLGALGRVVPPLAVKAELARIGRYYASESMLVLDPATGRYDAAATPSTGTETLFDFYARLIKGEVSIERGDHAVF